MILGVADYSGLEGSLGDFLDFASELKVSVLELKLDRIELLSALSKPSRMRDVKTLLNSYGFEYFVHAPNIDTNLASANPFLRRVFKKIVLRAITFAAELDACLVVSHVGRLSRDYPKNLVRKAVRNVAGSLKEINQVSNDRGVTFTIENDHESSDCVLAGRAEQLDLLLKDVGCKLTLDVGHANTIGKIEDFTKLLDRFIVNVHLHDNNGRRDEHLPLGKGSIDFAGLFDGMKDWMSRKPLVVECHSFAGFKESIDFMNRFSPSGKEGRATLK